MSSDVLRFVTKSIDSSRPLCSAFTMQPGMDDDVEDVNTSLTKMCHEHATLDFYCLMCCLPCPFAAPSFIRSGVAWQEKEKKRREKKRAEQQALQERMQARSAPSLDAYVS